MLRVDSSASSTGAIGVPWVMRFRVRDQYGWAVITDVPVVTVTLPDTTTALATVTADLYYNGIYEAVYTPLATGRYTARATTLDYGVVDLLRVVTAAVIALPDVDDVNDYLGGSTEHAWTADEMQSALDAETVAQMNVCRVPPAYPAALREALLRRTARNLAMRRQLTAEPRSEGDTDLPAILPAARDPEIRRLEGPYRRLPIG